MVIIVSVAVAVIGTLWLQGTTFGPVVNLDVLTESAGQLAEGNAVTYRGVRIGQVTTIAVLPDGSGVRVTLLMESDVALPRDPVAILAPESFFGNGQIEIVSRASYPRVPFFEVPNAAENGAPVIGGYALPELTRLTRTADEIATNIEELTNRLELAFNEETTNNFADAIENIQMITEAVRELVTQQGEAAATIVANADTTLAEIELAAGAARRSFESVERTIDDAELDSLFANMRTASSEIRRVAAALADTTSGLGPTLGRADSAFARLDRIAARVEAGDGSLGRLLGDSTLVVRAEEILAELELLLQDLQENPSRYVRLSIF
jgi:phospholipid/cholesterol/gamma-HCH transport system substrate-binding protein